MSILKPKGSFQGHRIEEEQRNYLEPGEVRSFFKAAKKDPYWYGYFYIQYYFGCRVSEPSLILKSDDLLFDAEGGSKIVIRRLKKKNEGGFQEHVYFMPDKMRDVIEGVLKIHKDRRAWKRTLFLFPARGGRKSDKPQERMTLIRRVGKQSAVSRATAHRAFQALCATAKIPERLRRTHILRHTRATLLLASGASLEQVQLILGHSSPKTTMLYAHTAKSVEMKFQKSALLDKGFEV